MTPKKTLQYIERLERDNRELREQLSAGIVGTGHPATNVQVPDPSQDMRSDNLVPSAFREATFILGKNWQERLQFRFERNEQENRNGVYCYSRTSNLVIRPRSSNTIWMSVER